MVNKRTLQKAQISVKMAKVNDITTYLEEWAPRAYQESYDNSGLITGNPNTTVNGILTTLDCTEAIVDEAIARNCNLIVAHHPILFLGLKKLTGSNYVERTLIKAIKNDICIYAIHTNLDNVHSGVNAKIANKLGLINTRILAPKRGLLSKIEAFVPQKDSAYVLQALHKAGAGNIGNYSQCSFRLAGTGTFLPNEKANPAIGRQQVQEEVQEDKLELIFPSHLQHSILSALKAAHPYEEVAYYVQQLENQHQEVGSGQIGQLASPLSSEEFLSHVKSKMNLSVIKHTELTSDRIETVAVCGGAGSFLLQNALKAKADAFITSDFKYHEFFDAEGKIMIADIGHYESEVYTKDLICEYIRENFPNIATYLSEVNTNPVQYF